MIWLIQSSKKSLGISKSFHRLHTIKQMSSEVKIRIHSKTICQTLLKLTRYSLICRVGSQDPPRICSLYQGIRQSPPTRLKVITLALEVPRIRRPVMRTSRMLGRRRRIKWIRRSPWTVTYRRNHSLFLTSPTGPQTFSRRISMQSLDLRLTQSMPTRSNKR